MSFSDEGKKDVDYSTEEKSPVHVSSGNETVTILSVDSKEADAALELVGTVRTAQFSEEYNNRLRRKLVCIFYAISGFLTKSH